MSGAKRAGRKRVGHSTAEPTGGVRERILDAAIAILGESGLQHLTQPQVAERAGVRQSHLTYYFPTRQDLLEAVTARAVEGIAGGVRRAVGDDAGPDLGPMLSRFAASVADLAHMRMFLALLVEADGDPALRALMLGGTRRLEAALADVLGGDGATERARLVLAAVWGLGLYHFFVRPSAKSGPARAYLSWVADVARDPSARGRRGRAAGS
jgi:AcrR family transcriptional regulator